MQLGGRNSAESVNFERMPFVLRNDLARDIWRAASVGLGTNALQISRASSLRKTSGILSKSTDSASFRPPARTLNFHLLLPSAAAARLT